MAEACYYSSMNWEDLRLLNAAAETRSLSAAARRLGISQPTLSRRLRALEDASGARLFDRTPSGLSPTPAGERLIPLVADMAAAAEAVSRAAPSLPETASGTVRISAETVVSRLLASHADRLMARAPGITFEFVTYHAEVSLSRREADLLIRECQPDGSSLITRRLGDMAYAVYGHRDLVRAHPEAIGEERYAACPWVGFAEDRLFFPTQKKWLDARLDAVGAPPPRLRATEIGVLVDAIEAGAGLGLAPCLFADRLPALERLTPPIDALTSRYHLLIHRDVLREPAVRAGTDALVALFRALRPALLGTSAPVGANRRSEDPSTPASADPAPTLAGNAAE